MTGSETADPPPRTRETVLFTGLGVIADTAAVAQLVTSGSVTGILVTGLLAALLGFVLLLRRLGEPLRVGDLLLALLIAVGSGTAGAAMDRLLTTPGSGVAAAPVNGAVSVTPSQAADGVTPGDDATSPASSPASPSPSGTTPVSTSTLTPTPTVSGGGVINKGEVTLADHDYLDLESGVVSEVNATVDILYDAPYTDIWTKGGGELWITPFAGTPTRTACDEQLRRRHYGSVGAEKNAWFCLETTEQNIGAVRVVEMPTRDEGIVLSYIVWRR
ncbi:hypothetical protein [Nonomuraea dietziae]|uniref:hypothetical protein n=1 Tax=Nonomuraea dietziae TaxID=65515 RepID=UPI0033EFA0FD